MRIFALLISAILGLAVTLPAQAQVANPRDAIPPMVAAVEARDANAIAALYTEDAIILGAGRPVVAGREAIRDSWIQSFAGGYSVLEVGRPRTERGADRALMVFLWQATIQPEGGEAQQIVGRSMLYFTRVEGGWLISADMWQPAG
ncbi:YybH family protein [Pararhodobacter oceanensis]|uniref:YybH family protein n=1 Tax=Pararhodobacter oceanensis TaxID=2172121 RepID=UPI003A933EB5